VDARGFEPRGAVFSLLVRMCFCPAAVFVAAKNKMDLSLGVAIGSSVQVRPPIMLHSTVPSSPPRELRFLRTT
jgi:hypothetical protein